MVSWAPSICMDYPDCIRWRHHVDKQELMWTSCTVVTILVRHIVTIAMQISKIRAPITLITENAVLC